MPDSADTRVRSGAQRRLGLGVGDRHLVLVHGGHAEPAQLVVGVFLAHDRGPSPSLDGASSTRRRFVRALDSADLTVPEAICIVSAIVATD